RGERRHAVRERSPTRRELATQLDETSARGGEGGGAEERVRGKRVLRPGGLLCPFVRAVGFGSRRSLGWGTRGTDSNAVRQACLEQHLAERVDSDRALSHLVIFALLSPKSQA